MKLVQSFLTPLLGAIFSSTLSLEISTEVIAGVEGFVRWWKLMLPVFPWGWNNSLQREKARVMGFINCRICCVLKRRSL